MAVQIVSDFYNLFPNKLTLVFTIGSIVLVAVGNALFRRYKVNNMQSSKYGYGPKIINHYHFPYFIFDLQYVQRCSKVPGPPTQIPLFGSASEFVLPPERILRYQQPFQMQKSLIIEFSFISKRSCPMPMSYTRNITKVQLYESGSDLNPGFYSAGLKVRR